MTKTYSPQEITPDLSDSTLELLNAHYEGLVEQANDCIAQIRSEAALCGDAGPGSLEKYHWAQGVLFVASAVRAEILRRQPEETLADDPSEDSIPF
jgi:hypothetical protein